MRLSIGVLAVSAGGAPDFIAPGERLGCEIEDGDAGAEVAGVVEVEADACLAELGGDYGAVDVVHGGGRGEKEGGSLLKV